MTELKEPCVSVITPAYNAERFIAETIESVRKQTYQNWEMIIVDDVSTDQTVDIIKQYSQIDERIKLVELDANSGAAVARNTAMDHSKGRYWAFLDSDDKWLLEKLSTKFAIMINLESTFSYTK